MLQLVRSNSRKFLPSHADEEAHQLSYLQKHVANILSILSDTLEGVEGDDAFVCIFLLCSYFTLEYF
jgi:TBCC domain-containing protein 1